MPSRRTNNFPESGRGLGHVTPTIFGSTVGLRQLGFLLFLRRVGRYHVTWLLNRELVSRAKMCLVSVFPDIVKDCPKVRNLLKIFLRSFENVSPDNFLMENNLRTTGCRLPYGIPPDTDEHTAP